MNTTRSLRALITVLPGLAISALAQSGTPVSAPPPDAPVASESAPASASSARTTEESAPISLTDATNSTGKTSGNGTLRELRFPAVDADSDGLISRSEFSTFMDAGSVARAADASGATATDALFRHIDRNSDNFLSESELTAYQQEQDANGAQR